LGHGVDSGYIVGTRLGLGVRLELRLNAAVGGIPELIEG